MVLPRDYDSLAALVAEANDSSLAALSELADARLKSVRFFACCVI
jgi:hypothetical protein